MSVIGIYIAFVVNVNESELKQNLLELIHIALLLI